MEVRRSEREKIHGGREAVRIINERKSTNLDFSLQFLFDFRILSGGIDKSTHSVLSSTDLPKKSFNSYTNPILLSLTLSLFLNRSSLTSALERSMSGWRTESRSSFSSSTEYLCILPKACDTRERQSTTSLKRENYFSS